MIVSCFIERTSGFPCSNVGVSEYEAWMTRKGNEEKQTPPLKDKKEFTQTSSSWHAMSEDVNERPG